MPHHAYQTLKAAAADYLEAQVELAVAARQAQDAGLAVTELHARSITPASNCPWAADDRASA